MALNAQAPRRRFPARAYYITFPNGRMPCQRQATGCAGHCPSSGIDRQAGESPAAARGKNAVTQQPNKSSAQPVDFEAHCRFGAVLSCSTVSNTVTIIGPREKRRYAGQNVISTNSDATGWSRGLSPCFLGPCPLYGGHIAKNVENAWQFAKLYPAHAAKTTGLPTRTYWAWATAGWTDPRAYRHPMGKGAIPLSSFWNETRLTPLGARQEIYFPLYRNAVRQSAPWQQLKAIHQKEPVVLFDAEGYDHEAEGGSLALAMTNTAREFSHAFILKAMLLLGEDVTPNIVREQLAATPVLPVTPQADLFRIPA